MKFNINEIMIGGDPEFIMVDQDNKTVAAELFPHFNSLTAKIGRDGGHIPLEIRPEPFPINRVEDFCQEVFLLIRETAKTCNEHGLTLHGGANPNGNPIGGHIHFGSRFLKVKYNDDLSIHGDSDWNENTKDKLTKFMDKYFTPIAFLLFNERDQYNRLNNGYGHIHDYRNQPHGIEYRTPYCFLLSKQFIKGLYALAALIAQNFRKMKLDKTQFIRIKKFYKNYFKVSSYDNYDIKDIYKNAKSKILKMMKYNSPNPKLNPYILSLFSLIERNKQMRSTDVLANLGIPKNTINKLGEFIFSTHDYMDSIKYDITNKRWSIRPKDNIYIYGIGDTLKKKDRLVIYISDNLPRPKPSGIDIKYKNHPTYKYSIGLSWGYRRYLCKYGNHYSLFNYLEQIVKEQLCVES